MRVSEFKRMVEGEVLHSLELQRVDEHRKLHEAEESPACRIRFRKGEKFKISEMTRVIPDPKKPGFYFGGEASDRSSRGRGTTAMTIPPGTMLMCYDVQGAYGWFVVPSEYGNLKVRIHVNKFCPVTREAEKNKRAGKTVKKGEISDADLAVLLGEEPPTAPPKASGSKKLSPAEEMAQMKKRMAELEALMSSEEGGAPEEPSAEDDYSSLFQ